MKIFSVDQIQAADKYTIENEPITSIDLMERASLNVVEWLVNKFDAIYKIKIFCGPGNNGGDGLAIARILSSINYGVEVFIVEPTDKTSNDFKINLERIDKNKISITLINDANIINENSFQNAIIIDALFGSGLNKPLSGVYAEIVNKLNQINAIKISIDVPSGLYSDTLNSKEDIIFKSNYTLSFQFPKLSFMFPENAVNVGTFLVLDIGLHAKYISETPTQYYFIDKNLISSFLKTRISSAHKGNFGHALLLCGSYGKIGAASLASKACLKSGVGLLSVNIPACGYNIMQTSIPEAMVISDDDNNFLTKPIEIKPYNAIGIGCGIGIEEKTQQLVKSLIQRTTVPLVFDADAINCLSENKTWLAFLPVNSILTPHVKEFERLVGECANSVERLKKQIDFSISNKCYIVLKGQHTSITTPDGKVFFNSTGNPGMATAGSGDVLLGIITSLLAQKYSALQACLLGVYVHGLAGDIASFNLSQESMTSGSIIDYLDEAFQKLHSENEI